MFFRHLLICLSITFYKFTFQSTIILKVSLIPYFMDFFKSSTFFAAFITLANPFLVTVQFFGRFLMAFNRFTSIWFPLNYQQFWKRQWYTVLLMLIPFLTICWKLHEPVRYTYLANGSLLSVYTNDSVRLFAKGFSAMIYFTITIASAIFNGLSFAKFSYNRNKSVNYRLKEQHLLCKF